MNTLFGNFWNLRRKREKTSIGDGIRSEERRF